MYHGLVIPRDSSVQNGERNYVIVSADRHVIKDSVDKSFINGNEALETYQRWGKGFNSPIWQYVEVRNNPGSRCKRLGFTDLEACRGKTRSAGHSGSVEQPGQGLTRTTFLETFSPEPVQLQGDLDSQVQRTTGESWWPSLQVQIRPTNQVQRTTGEIWWPCLDKTAAGPGKTRPRHHSCNGSATCAKDRLWSSFTKPTILRQQSPAVTLSQISTATLMMVCLWHGEERCQDWQCSNPQATFVCEIHTQKNCDKCILLIEWCNDIINAQPWHKMPYELCKGHNTEQICDNWLCTVCNKCYPTHKANSSLLLDVATHLGSEFTLRGNKDGWYSASRSGNYGPNIQRIYDFAESARQEEIIAGHDESRGIKFRSENDCKRAVTWLLAQHPNIMYKDFPELIKFINSRMDSEKMQLAVCIMLAYNLNFRSAVTDKVRLMSNVVSYRRDCDVIELSVPTRTSFNETPPDLTTVMVPATLVRCRNNKPVVFIKHQDYQRPGWIMASDLAKYQFRMEALNPALNKLRFRILLFTALSTASTVNVPLMDKLNLLSDFRSIGPHMLINVLFVTAAAERGLNRFCNLSIHTRHQYTKNSGLVLTQGDNIGRMFQQESGMSLEDIQNVLRNMADEISVSIDLIRPHTAAILAQQCSDTKFNTYQLLSVIGKYKKKFDLQFVRLIQKDLFSTLERIGMKVYNYLNREPRSRGEYNASYYYRTSHLNKSFPVWGVNAEGLTSNTNTERLMSNTLARLERAEEMPRQRPQPPQKPERSTTRKHKDWTDAQVILIPSQAPSESQSKRQVTLNNRKSPFTTRETGTKPKEHKRIQNATRKNPPLQLSERIYCSSCYSDFAEWSKYKIHRSIHCTKIRYCYLCGRQFEEPISRQEHLEGCIAIRSWRPDQPCEVCGKTFSKLEHLEDHLTFFHPHIIGQPVIPLTMEYSDEDLWDDQLLQELGDQPFEAPDRTAMVRNDNLSNRETTESEFQTDEEHQQAMKRRNDSFQPSKRQKTDDEEQNNRIQSKMTSRHIPNDQPGQNIHELSNTQMPQDRNLADNGNGVMMMEEDRIPEPTLRLTRREEDLHTINKSLTDEVSMLRKQLYEMELASNSRNQSNKSDKENVPESPTNDIPTKTRENPFATKIRKRVNQVNSEQAHRTTVKPPTKPTRKAKEEKVRVKKEDTDDVESIKPDTPPKTRRREYSGRHNTPLSREERRRITDFEGLSENEVNFEIQEIMSSTKVEDNRYKVPQDILDAIETEGLSDAEIIERYRSPTLSKLYATGHRVPGRNKNSRNFCYPEEKENQPSQSGDRNDPKKTDSKKTPFQERPPERKVVKQPEKKTIQSNRQVVKVEIERMPSLGQKENKVKDTQRDNHSSNTPQLRPRPQQTTGNEQTRQQGEDKRKLPNFDEITSAPDIENARRRLRSTPVAHRSRITRRNPEEQEDKGRDTRRGWSRPGANAKINEEEICLPDSDETMEQSEDSVRPFKDAPISGEGCSSEKEKGGVQSRGFISAKDYYKQLKGITPLKPVSQKKSRHESHRHRNKAGYKADREERNSRENSGSDEMREWKKLLEEEQRMDIRDDSHSDLMNKAPQHQSGNNSQQHGSSNRQQNSSHKGSNHGQRNTHSHKGSQWNRYRESRRRSHSSSSSSDRGSRDRRRYRGHGGRGHHRRRGRRSPSSTDSSCSPPRSTTASATNLPKVNKIGNETNRQILLAQAAGSWEAARQIHDESTFRLEGADKDLQINMELHDNLPWKDVVDELEFDYDKFGHGQLRSNAFNNMEKWSPDSCSQETTSQSLVEHLRAFLKICYAAACTKKQALAYLEMTVSYEVSAVMATWRKSEIASGKKVTLLKYLYQMFKLYYKINSEYSATWLRDKKKSRNETWQLLYWALMKHTRIANSQATKSLPEETKATWLEEQLKSHITRLLNAEEATFIAGQNRTQKTLVAPPLTALSICKALDELKAKTSEGTRDGAVFRRLEDRTSQYSDSDGSRKEKAEFHRRRGEASKRNKKFRYTKKEKDAQLEKELRQEKVRRLRISDDDEDCRELLSELEDELRLQEKDHKNFPEEVRRYLVQRSQLNWKRGFKDLAGKVNVLLTSCFKCGSLRHLASGCTYFKKGTACHWRPCNSCKQGGHLPEDFLPTEELKTCIDLRRKIRQDNSDMLKVDPDRRLRVFKEPFKYKRFKVQRQRKETDDNELGDNQKGANATVNGQPVYRATVDSESQEDSEDSTQSE